MEKYIAVGKSARAFLKLADIIESRYKAGAVYEANNAAHASVIVVVGAGASFSSGMPSWIELKELIIKTAEESYRNSSDFIEEAWRKLSPIIGVKDPSWSLSESRERLIALASVEMICRVACDSDVVGEKILTLFREKYQITQDDSLAGPPPQLGYELLSHFLKHQFIDHIITFNFDEVLDEAISNELGSGEYDLILSDQHILSNPTPDKPRLIKLHGSISSPQTLRFRRDNTDALSNEMIKLLDNTLFINPKIGKPNFPLQAVHIISLGYSWNDRDFANWIISRRQYISSLTVIKLENEFPFLLEKLINENNTTEVNIISTKELSNLPIKGKPAAQAVTIDQFLWALWNELEQRLNKSSTEYIPTSRHLILGYLFGPDPSDPRAVPKFFLNNHTTEVRLRAEVYLHLVKCKGMINASVMARDPRISRYYKKFRSMQLQQDNPVDFYEEIVLSPFADVKETYFAKAETLEKLIDQISRNPHFMGDKVYEPIFNIATEKINLSEIKHVDFMQRHLKTIFRADEVEIARWIDPRSDWLFNNPNAVNTYLALKRVTSELIQGEWSHLLIIAESGAWLFDEKIIKLLSNTNFKRTVLILKASDNSLEGWRLRRKIDDYLESKEKELPMFKFIKAGLNWWEHNRHLTLAFNETMGSFMGGIYFRRTLKTSRISPIHVQNNKDCTELFFTFLSYVRRLYEDANNDPNKNEICKAVCAIGACVRVEAENRDRLNRLLEKLRSNCTEKA